MGSAGGWRSVWALFWGREAGTLVMEKSRVGSGRKPFDDVESLAALEAEKGEVTHVDREDTRDAGLFGKPDQRRVGEVDVAAGVAADRRRQVGIGCKGNVDHAERSSARPFEELSLGMRAQEKAGLDDDGRNGHQGAALR